MADVIESPVLRFQRMYRDEWAKLLRSDMGQTLISAAYAQRPLAIVSDQPNKDSYVLGKVFQHDLVMNFLANTLCSVPQVAKVEVPQTYPPEDEQKPTVE